MSLFGTYAAWSAGREWKCQLDFGAGTSMDFDRSSELPGQGSNNLEAQGLRTLNVGGGHAFAVVLDYQKPLLIGRAQGNADLADSAGKGMLQSVTDEFMQDKSAGQRYLGPPCAIRRLKYEVYGISLKEIDAADLINQLPKIVGDIDEFVRFRMRELFIEDGRRLDTTLSFSQHSFEPLITRSVRLKG